jgi:3-hydroxyisobutyrate dehydrogenase
MIILEEGNMARIGFVGLGNMGLPMALNLVKAGHAVSGFDVNAAAMDTLAAAGGQPTSRPSAEVDIVMTMLPSGVEVREVYVEAGGVLDTASPDTLLIDCSTIDVDVARAVAAAAQASTLTFMVGGPQAAFARAKPLLEAMGKTIVHAGSAGNGQAAKICNNMILGISMIAVSEAFVLAEKLGLDHQKLFDIASRSSGQCWSLTNYCPVPGPVPTSPANRDYQPGFTAAMMLKDLKLAQDAARAAGATTPLGAEAAALYGLYVAHGAGHGDFSGIIRFLRGQ